MVVCFLSSVQTLAHENGSNFVPDIRLMTSCELTSGSFRFWSREHLCVVVLHLCTKICANSSYGNISIFRKLTAPPFSRRGRSPPKFPKRVQQYSTIWGAGAHSKELITNDNIHNWITETFLYVCYTKNVTEHKTLYDLIFFSYFIGHVQCCFKLRLTTFIKRILMMMMMMMMM